MKYILILSLILLVGCSSIGKKETGVVNGVFYPCPKSPNCVSSMAPKDDSHYIEHISYDGFNREIARNKIINILEGLKKTTIVESQDNYIHAEARSSFFNFVDDVEFYLPENEKIIHIRSLARLGYSDFGVNRKRIEEIKVKFNE